MTLIVENGTGVVGANTYASDSDFVAYAAARGLTIPAAAADREVLLIKAMDWLESKRYWFIGTKVLGTNSLQWPRTGAQLDSFDILPTAIPVELVKAECVLAVAAITYDLTPVLPAGYTGPVKREAVGPVSVEYASPKDSMPRVVVQQADDLLRGLLRPMFLQVQRF